MRKALAVILLFAFALIANEACAQRSGKDSISVKTSIVQFPQITTAQMNAFTRQEQGATIFNITTKTLWAYNGTEWVDLGLQPETGSITVDDEISISSLNPLENQAAGKRFIKTVDDATSPEQVKMWVGTKSEYNIALKDRSTVYIVTDSIYDPSPSGEGVDGLVSDVALNGTRLDFTGRNGAFSGSIPLDQLDVNGEIAQVDQQITTFQISPLDFWQVQLERDVINAVDTDRFIQNASQVKPTDDFVIDEYTRENLQINLPSIFSSKAEKPATNYHYSSSYPNYRVHNNRTGQINSAWRLNPSLYGTDLSFPYSFGDLFPQVVSEFTPLNQTAGPGLRQEGQAGSNPYGNDTNDQIPNIDPDVQWGGEDPKGKVVSYKVGNILFFFIEAEMGYGTGLFFTDADPRYFNVPEDNRHYYMNAFDFDDLSAGDYVSLWGYAGGDIITESSSVTFAPLDKDLYEPSPGNGQKISLNITTVPSQAELLSKGWYISARADWNTDNAPTYEPTGLNMTTAQRMRSIFGQDGKAAGWRVNIGALPVRHGRTTGDTDTNLYAAKQQTISTNPIKLYISGAIPIE